MPKLGFLLGAMRAQEGSCIHKILYVYAGWNLCAHKLENKYLRARTSLRMHEYKLRTQE